jgi:hypothetical protein
VWAFPPGPGLAQKAQPRGEGRGGRNERSGGEVHGWGQLLARAVRLPGAASNGVRSQSGAAKHGAGNRRE